MSISASPKTEVLLGAPFGTGSYNEYSVATIFVLVHDGYTFKKNPVLSNWVILEVFIFLNV